MYKYILGIDGMRCGMCEMHVEETIRKSMSIKKIKASHIKNRLTVISEEDISENGFHMILDPTGYRIVSYQKTIAIKGLFGWK